MIKLQTEYPIAFDSPDHLEPHGTRHDNSVNMLFNEKMYKMFRGKILRVLDLGCSGGGFIKSVVDDGNIAVGLEGSDWSLKMHRAAWPAPYLFTCDIAKPFQIYEDEKPMKFDVITAWEVLEHIKGDDLPQLLQNIRTHLAPNGLFIATVNLFEDCINGVHLHQTIKPRHWWEGQLNTFDFNHSEKLLQFFNGHLIRTSSRSAHFVCCLNGNNFNYDLNQTPKQRIMDSWLESSPQKFLKRLLT